MKHQRFRAFPEFPDPEDQCGALQIYRLPYFKDFTTVILRVQCYEFR